MPELPTTRYAQSGELNIAYQVMGGGPVDLILVPGLITHLEFLHEFPGYTDFLRRLAAFARVVTFDKSGQGLSDRAAGMPSLEQRIDDIRAVMEAVGSTRAAVLGCSVGAPSSVLFAATYPERPLHSRPGLPLHPQRGGAAGPRGGLSSQLGHRHARHQELPAEPGG
jgi:pimeloyl-ACP methyl ester carboxylesterase